MYIKFGYFLKLKDKSFESDKGTSFGCHLKIQNPNLTAPLQIAKLMKDKSNFMQNFNSTGIILEDLGEAIRRFTIDPLMERNPDSG